MTDMPWLLALAGAAVVVLVIALFGMVWPRFLAWVSNLVTIVAGVAVLFALAFSATEYVNLKSDLRVARAVLTGNKDGLTDDERLRALGAASPERTRNFLDLLREMK